MFWDISNSLFTVPLRLLVEKSAACVSKRLSASSTINTVFCWYIESSILNDDTALSLSVSVSKLFLNRMALRPHACISDFAYSVLPLPAAPYKSMLVRLLFLRSEMAISEVSFFYRKRVQRICILCVYFCGIIIKERLQIVCHNADFELRAYVVITVNKIAQNTCIAVF